MRKIAALGLIAAVQLATARQARAHGALDERLAAVTAAMASHPEDPKLPLQLAALQAEHGDFEGALLSLAQVDRLAPGQYSTDILRGSVLLAANKPQAAKALLDPVIASHPDNARALLLRARAAARLGLKEQSLADFRATLKNTPKPEPDLFYEVTAALVAAQRVEEAVEVLASAVVTLGPVPSLLERLLELEIQAGHFEAALGRVEQLRQNSRRPEPWMARRAAILTLAGRPEEARAAWLALRTHLQALSAAERGSHAMSTLAGQTENALAAFPQKGENSSIPGIPQNEATALSTAADNPDGGKCPGSN